LGTAFSSLLPVLSSAFSVMSAALLFLRLVSLQVSFLLWVFSRQTSQKSEVSALSFSLSSLPFSFLSFVFFQRQLWSLLHFGVCSIGGTFAFTLFFMLCSPHGCYR
jgi:hypothetical protein